MHFTTTTIVGALLALQAAALPSINKRYVPGQCGAHIQQFQKNEGPSDTSVCRLTIELKDANGADLGGVNTAPAPAGQGVNVDSELPAVFIATTGYVDSDPIQFAYNGQNWASSTSQCSTGKYDSGSRQIDCGFQC